MTKAVWQPTDEYKASTRLYQWMNKLGYTEYDEFFEQSVADTAWLWDEAVRDMGIVWHTPYEQVVDLSKGIQWPQWFTGGRLNVTDNAVYKWLDDPQVKTQAAMVWEGEDGQTKRYTYEQVAEWVDRVAAGFERQGIGKGDRVALYMPMIPETVVSMLAIAKIGAIFLPTFSGYGADAVAKRLQSAQAKMLVTADGFYRRGKVVPMKETADEAVKLSPSVRKLVVVDRIGREYSWNEETDIRWSDLEADVESAAKTGVPMAAGDPFMIIYTSGTTGRPKGAVHTHSGFPVKAAFDAAYSMDVKQGDVMFWVTDMGWMMGPFLVYATLLNGATMVLYEGTPTHPAPDRLWKVSADHRVTHLGISPTLIRSLQPLGVEHVRRHDLSRLRVIGSTGEPWNRDPWLWLFEQVGGKQVPIVNYSGGTEISGGILSNVLLKPIAPVDFNSPLPGMDVDVLDASGRPVRNEVGELVLKQPWVGMTKGFWEEPERYEETYWSRFPDTWVHGDWVIRDDEGFYTITGRSDDTLNIAGKRIGPAEMESVLVGHDQVQEAGTIGVPDAIKGEAAVCFVVTKPGVEPDAALKKELLALISKKMGKALRPKDIYFVNDLPKTRNAKVMRRAIRSAYLGKDSGDLSALENPDAVQAIRSLAEDGQRT